MKNAKYTLIVLASLLSLNSVAQAEYIIKIPLEQKLGGSLPDGSIIIGKRPDVTNPDGEEPLDPNNPCSSFSSKTKSAISSYSFFTYKSLNYMEDMGVCVAEADLTECPDMDTVDAAVQDVNSKLNGDNIYFTYNQLCEFPQPEMPAYNSQTLYYVNSTQQEDFYQSTDGREFLSVQRTYGGDIKFHSDIFVMADYNYVVFGQNECRFWESGGSLHSELLKCPTRIYDDANKPASLTLKIKHYSQAQTDIDSYNNNYPLDQRLLHPYTGTDPNTGEEKYYFYYDPIY